MTGAALERRPVAITGLGCVSPLGGDVESTWEAAVAGRSGVSAIRAFDASEFPVQFAGQAADELNVENLSHKEARRLDRFVHLALAAAEEGLRDARLDLGGLDTARVGVAIGSGIGGLTTLTEAQSKLDKAGPGRVSPFMIPMSICNMASGYVAIHHGLRGPNLCPVAACASGAHAIGEALHTLQRGDADVIVAGGAEAPVSPLGVAGFAAMRALSTRNEDPAAASRPFDRGRDGFVISEGAAVLVLEGLEHARARGASIRGLVLGYGSTADAAHIAQPQEDAEGAQRCMRIALQDAGLTPAEVHYINPHATSTPAGDVAEARAIRAVFGGHADQVAVSATKSMTGHLLGAAGALEALLCVRSLESGVLPPTINLQHPDPECELDHVANKARSARIGVAMSNSFGFGGTNATLVLGRNED